MSSEHEPSVMTKTEITQCSKLVAGCSTPVVLPLCALTFSTIELATGTLDSVWRTVFGAGGNCHR
jgi:hypothetical protein